jgi:hypothetical protein
MDIKIFESAEELQNNWKPKLGDLYYLNQELYIGTDGSLTAQQYDNQRVYCNELTPYFTKGFNFVDQKFFVEEEVFSHSIFIPSQEYLQEKLLKKFHSDEAILFAFVKFYCNGSKINSYHFTELWLLFYYYYIYKLGWDGEDFVKIEIDKYEERLE